VLSILIWSDTHVGSAPAFIAVVCKTRLCLSCPCLLVLSYFPGLFRVVWLSSCIEWAALLSRCVTCAFVVCWLKPGILAAKNPCTAALCDHANPLLASVHFSACLMISRLFLSFSLSSNSDNGSITMLRHGSNTMIEPWSNNGLTNTRPIWCHRQFYRGFYGKRNNKIDYSKTTVVGILGYKKYHIAETMIHWHSRRFSWSYVTILYNLLLLL